MVAPQPPSSRQGIRPAPEPTDPEETPEPTDPGETPEPTDPGPTDPEDSGPGDTDQDGSGDSRLPTTGADIGSLSAALLLVASGVGALAFARVRRRI